MLQKLLRRSDKISPSPSFPLDDRAQASTEYLLLTAMAILIALFAAAALLQVMKMLGVEANFLRNYEEKVMEVLLS